MKIPVITSDDYIVFLEKFETFTFIHCDCFKWSNSVRKQLEEDFNKLMTIHRKDIYAFHELEDNKHLKFLNMFNFSYVQDVVGLDSVTRQLFKREYHGN